MKSKTVEAEGLSGERRYLRNRRCSFDAYLVITCACYAIGLLPIASGNRLHPRSATADQTSVTVDRILIRPPSLNVSDEMVLSAGHNLTIRCVGDLPVTWNCTPAAKISSSSLTKRTTISSGRVDNSSEYESILVLTKLMYLDTGYYRCFYPGDPGNSSTASTYLYVFDGSNLLVTTAVSKVVYAVQDRPVFVDWCRATHPNVTFELVKFRKNRTWTYDPRLGVVFSKADIELEGTVTCMAKLDNLTQKHNPYIQYLAKTRRAPVVSLSSTHEGGRVLTRDSINFTCQANLERGASVITVTWIYPQKNSEHSRIIEGNATKESYIQKVTGHLYVTDVTIGDTGTYSCLVSDHDEKSGSAQLNVTAYEKSFVHLTTDHEIVESRLDEQFVLLSTRVDAYPDPQLTWYRDGHPISLSKHKSKYDGLDSSELKIFNVHSSDAGVYTLMGKNRDAASSANVTLLVNVAPSLVIHSPILESPLFTVNQNYSLECRSEGFPEPKVNWAWQLCNDSYCSSLPVEDAWEPVQNSKHFAWVMSKGKDSRLTVTAKASCWYRCTAQNQMGLDIEIKKFIVTKKKKVPTATLR